MGDMYRGDDIGRKGVREGRMDTQRTDESCLVYISGNQESREMGSGDWRAGEQGDRWK